MKTERCIDDYLDIINLPHPVSKKHPPMPRISRAAQFASFAALSGYEDNIQKTAEEHRPTDGVSLDKFYDSV